MNLSAGYRDPEFNSSGMYWIWKDYSGWDVFNWLDQAWVPWKGPIYEISKFSSICTNLNLVSTCSGFSCHPTAPSVQIEGRIRNNKDRRQNSNLRNYTEKVSNARTPHGAALGHITVCMSDYIKSCHSWPQIDSLSVGHWNAKAMKSLEGGLPQQVEVDSQFGESLKTSDDTAAF